MTATGPSSGAVVLDGTTLDYAGLEPVTITGSTAEITLGLPANSTNATLTDSTTAGDLVLLDPGLADHRHSRPRPAI